MKEIVGNLVTSAKANPDLYDVIVHGCNCFKTMGAGIAKAIKFTFPEAYDVDVKDPRDAIERLGSISYTNNTKPIVCNAYTQFGFKGPNNVEYSAIKSAMKEIKRTFSGKKIAMPLIGAGLAGGNWKVISEIIKRELEGEDVTIIIFENDITKTKVNKINPPTINLLSSSNVKTDDRKLDDLLADFDH